MVRPTMPTSTDEREWFHYTIENITKDITRYNYWVPETSHVSPLLVYIPYYESSCSTEYLPFFLTSLSTLYSLYRSISISWLFPLLVSIPYYEPSRSTEYLPLFLTSLSTSYSLYRSISISWLFPLLVSIPYYQPSRSTPQGTSRYSSHLYPHRIVSTGPSPSHNFFPLWLIIFIEIFPTTFLIL